MKNIGKKMVLLVILCTINFVKISAAYEELPKNIDKLTLLKEQVTLINSKKQKVDDKLISYVNLNEHIYKNTLDDFADLRLVDSTNGVVPFVVAKALCFGEKRQISTKLKVTDFSQNTQQQYIEFIVAVPKNVRNLVTKSLQFKTTYTQSFHKKIEVLGSKNGIKYFNLISNDSIYNYADSRGAKKLNVLLSDIKNSQFLKIRLSDIGDNKTLSNIKVTHNYEKKVEQITSSYKIRKFGVNSVILTSLQDAAVEKIVEYPHQSLITCNDISQSSEEDLITKYGENCTVLEVFSNRQPLRYFLLFTDTAVYKRGYDVYGYRDGNYQFINNGIISLNILAKNSLNSNYIYLNSTNERFEKYRIIIKDGESPKLSNIKLKYFGYVYQIKFFSQKNKEYKILFNASRKSYFQYVPNYDVSSFLDNKNTVINCNKFSLGKTKKNIEFEELKAKSVFLLPHWLLWSLIVFTALVLLIVTLKLLSHSEKIFDDEESDDEL
ncbi:hypothetical protein AAEX28_00985 [Lentisphaerota bacterium WC36G]|nr:hypothetical protein LJT99_03865 [Lentisphaerae bacterium WC36]